MANEYDKAPPGYHTPREALAVLLTLSGRGGQDGKLHEQCADDLEKAAQMIEDEAKRVIGTYEYGWPPLAEATVKRKGQDTPLYETGMLRDSIQHTVDRRALTASVGSDDPVAVYQELGTSRGIPPRSFLMGAAMHKEAEIVAMTGADIHGLMLKEMDID